MLKYLLGQVVSRNEVNKIIFGQIKDLVGILEEP